MSKWMPIETAPHGVRVKLGRWIKSDGQWRWVDDAGTPFEVERGFWSWSKPIVRRTFDGGYYSHWKPLPSPPTDEER